VPTTLIFDCDGVLADTERYGHLPAFNQTFEEFGLPVRWSEEDYAQKLLIGGGKERMRSLLTPQFVAEAGLPADKAGQDEAIAAWHRRKTEIYTAMVADGKLPGRPGVRRVIAAAADAGWRLAVASTSAEPSVRAVLEHAAGPELSRDVAVFAGDIVPAKKPAPDIYQLAVRELGADPARTVASRTPATGCSPRAAPGCRRSSPSTPTPRTRTSPAPRSSSARSATRASRPPCWPTGPPPTPATSSN
jgi:beta-phosphoglucomutase-like phosphatase (HAD superfamily)